MWTCYEDLGGLFVGHLPGEGIVHQRNQDQSPIQKTKKDLLR